MTWSKFDDGYDEHEKIEDAWFAFPANPVGLHVMATTACNRWLSDGVIRPRWLAHKLPAPKPRAALLAAMVKLGLLDVLEAGETAALEDSAGNPIIVGPFDEDRYLVHDFLDRHDSSVQVKERRRKDAERKGSKQPPGKPGGFRLESVRNPDGVQGDSQPSRAGGRASAGALPDPTRPDQEAPQPPQGGRKRDHDLFSGEMGRWAEEHFPGAHVSKVSALAERVRTVGWAATPDAMNEYARRHPAYTLGDNRNDGNEEATA